MSDAEPKETPAKWLVISHSCLPARPPVVVTLLCILAARVDAAGYWWWIAVVAVYWLVYGLTSAGQLPYDIFAKWRK